MRIRFTYIILSLLTLFAVSCAESETVETQQVGLMQFAFSSVPADSTVTLTVSSADGMYSHTWPDASKFSSIELFFVGEYKAEAYAGVPGSEGFDCPSYYGSAEFEVKHMQQTMVDIDCSLMQAVMTVTATESPSAPYAIGDVTLHTSGHAYVDISRDETRPAYIMPGETEVYLSLADAGGRKLNLVSGFRIPTSSGESYKIEINEDTDGTITLKCGALTHTMNIDPTLFDSSAPSITSSGFSPDEPLHVIEGFPAAYPILMHVDASAPLSALRLTINGFDSKSTDYHIDIDLMSHPELLKGLKLDMPSPSTADIDFTGLIETYQIDRSVNVTFTLQATDIFGRMSEPFDLDVLIESVDFTLIYKSGAEIGVDEASIKLQLNVSEVEAHDFTIFTDTGTQLDITSTHWDASTMELTLHFKVPSGTSSVPIKIYFLGVEKLTTEIERSSPDFDIYIDPFAKRARITISAATTEIADMVTRNAHVSVPGANVAVTTRDPANGLLEIAGLEPGRRYTLSLWVIDNEHKTTRQFTTETARQVPSGDFEEVEDNIKYKRLPSGGEYSASRFAIYNQQNFTDISVSWPKKYWASINEKTFCKGATLHNTWYMQPSAAIDFSQSASGSKSIVLRSVGWSVNGEEIPPSVQPDNGFSPYNTNSPSTTNISAGRLFLGSYSFDMASMTEKYTEGVEFPSRPSSLDGFFKYFPDVTQVGDNGKIIVELVNDNVSPEIVVGSGEYIFRTAPDFRTFHVPINYSVYNTVVTRLRIMVMSSEPTSSGPYGDEGVPVTPDLESAAFVGSTLWIDNLSFSY